MAKFLKQKEAHGTQSHIIRVLGGFSVMTSPDLGSCSGSAEHDILGRVARRRSTG